MRAVVRGRPRDCESEFLQRCVYASFQANSRAATRASWQPSIRKSKVRNALYEFQYPQVLLRRTLRAAWRLRAGTRRLRNRRTGPTAADAPKAEIATAPKTETPRTQVAKPSEPVRETEPMTRSSAARECWMRTEKGNTREDLDKRADFVNKCIDEKMKAASTPAPNT
jgi:hypothetical protein